MPTRQTIRAALAEAATALDELRRDDDQLANLEAFAEAARTTLESGGCLIACGNGGSMSQAMHFAEEWTGRFRGTRPALPAIALSDPAQLTCIANDFGFEHVFSRQLEAHGRPGDLLLLLSTSGGSPNLLRAARTARDRGLTTVALLGRGGGKLAAEVDWPIVVPLTHHPDRIQEVHLQILHATVEAVERALHPELYDGERLPSAQLAGSRNSLKP